MGLEPALTIFSCFARSSTWSFHYWVFWSIILFVGIIYQSYHSLSENSSESKPYYSLLDKYSNWT